MNDSTAEKASNAENKLLQIADATKSDATRFWLRHGADTIHALRAEVAELREQLATEGIEAQEDARQRLELWTRLIASRGKVRRLEASMAEAQATIKAARGWDAAHTADNGETSYFGYGTLAEVLSAPSSTGGN